jgi:hypothetical protein
MSMSHAEYEREQRQQYEREEKQELAAKEHKMLVDALHESIDNILEMNRDLSVNDVLDELTFDYTNKEIVSCLDEINDIYEQKKEQLAQGE